MTHDWYSARIRLVMEIEGLGGLEYWDSVVLFRAADFDDALRRAVNVGRRMETDEVNERGERVRRRLHSVITLDAVAEPLDGAEVWAEIVDVPIVERGPFGTEYRPEHSNPTQTGIRWIEPEEEKPGT